MNLSLLLLNQLIVMICFSLIGFILARKKIVTMNGCKELVNLLLLVVIPFVVINSFLVEKSAEKSKNLIISLILTAIAFAIAILVSYCIYGTKKGIESFSSAFSNAGFIGIPLVQATLGDSMVFYIAGFVAFLNILQWIYGSYVITGDKRNISFRAISKNVVLISFILGILFYFLEFNNLPYIKSISQSIAVMNSPLAMIIIGIYMSEISLRSMVKRKSSYFCSLVRLLLIPLITIIIFVFLPFGDSEIKLAIIIVASAPVGANVAMFAQKFNKDYTLAVEIIILSTFICLVTIPALIYITQLFGMS